MPPPQPPEPPEPPDDRAERAREPPRAPPADRLRTTSALGSRARDVMAETREALTERLRAIDPGLLVDLTVGLRGPPVEDEAWHDVWHDRFNDGGHFDDVFIDLISDRPAQARAPEGPAHGVDAGERPPREPLG